MRDCTDPDCHANAFLAAHGDGCPDPSAHDDPERIGGAIGHAVTHAIRDVYTDALAHGTTYVNPDPRADDDPTADTAY